MPLVRFLAEGHAARTSDDGQVVIIENADPAFVVELEVLRTPRE